MNPHSWKRNLLACFVLVLVIPFASAEPARTSVATARATLSITNAAPEVLSVSFSGQPYADQPILCSAVIIDERPAEAELAYAWSVNGVLQTDEGETFLGAEEGDTITCTVMARDHLGTSSLPAGGSIDVKSTTLTTKTLNRALLILGATTSLEQTERLQGRGLAAITGFAVSESMSKRPELPVLAFLVLLLSVVNANLFLRWRIARGAAG